MSEVDWSKAPEGATHYIKNGSGGGVTWLFPGEYGVLHRIIDGTSVTTGMMHGDPGVHEIHSFIPLTSIEDAQPEGRKLDGGKVIMGAIPPDAELAVARVLTFGAEKYARDNWRKVTEMDVRYMDAALRHLNAHRRGEQVDSESGESHLAHAACCIMFLLQIEEESK